MLVTHDMATVQSALRPRDAASTTASCATSATPEEAALRYYRLNFGGDRQRRRGGARAAGRRTSTCAWSTPGCAGRRASAVENVEQGEPIGLDVVLEARRDLERPCSASTSSTPTARPCSASTRTLGRADRSRAGRRDPARRADREPAAARPLLRSTADRRATAPAAATSPCRGCGCSTSSSTARAPGPGCVSRRAPTSSRCWRRGDERRDVELRDVRGPSALGGGWRRALELLYLIAVTDFKRTTSAPRSATCGRSRGR